MDYVISAGIDFHFKVHFEVTKYEKNHTTRHQATRTDYFTIAAAAAWIWK